MLSRTAGFSCASVCWNWCRHVMVPHDRHVTSCTEPCSSITDVAPAMLCSLSTFCVMMVWTQPRRCSRARASCAALGRLTVPGEEQA